MRLAGRHCTSIGTAVQTSGDQEGSRVVLGSCVVSRADPVFDVAYSDFYTYMATKTPPARAAGWVRCACISCGTEDT